MELFKPFYTQNIQNTQTQLSRTFQYILNKVSFHEKPSRNIFDQ